MKIQMFYDNTVRTSPCGKCWFTHLTKPIKKWETNVYTITLNIDKEDPTSYDVMKREIEKFQKQFSEEIGGLKISNKLLYTNTKGYTSITFSVKDKGQGVPPCYNEDGEQTEPPIDGDVVEIKYTFAGWLDDTGKAGIKVYLHSVIVVDRTGRPKREPVDLEEDAWDETEEYT